MDQAKKFSPTKLDFLIAAYIFFILTSELLGAKTFPIVKLFGYQLNGSVAIFLIPFVYSINDIVTEVCGIARARNLAKISTILIICMALFIAFAVWLPASTRFQSSESAYELIFSQSIRIALASLTAFAIADFFDIYFFAKLKQKLSKYGLWFRNNVSNILSLLLDTLLFMTLAFYAFDKSFGDNVSFLWSIILPYWLLKVAMSALGTPLVYAGVKWLSKVKAENE